MAQPVWKARTAKEPDALIIALCAGRDTVAVPPADEALLPHDIHLNMAHALMLEQRGIISRDALRRLLRALRRIESRAAKGNFALDPAAEDVHMNVEQAIVPLAGADASGRLHTARSRNDQAATDMRLWLRESLGRSIEQTLALAEILAKRAKHDAGVVCPGFTHMQPAQVTTLGHLWASHATALARDVDTLQSCQALVGKCPLGAAASFGTLWPIDREWVAGLLGFDGPEDNSLDAIANRWEAEAHVAHAWAVTLTHLSALAQDIIWLSTPPREWVRLDDAHVTGSSIMPQKRNPDLAEVTRTRAAACQALAQAIVATATGQLSGYNRDLQWTKYHIMDAWWQIDRVPVGWGRMIEGLTLDRRAMRDACEVGFMESAEVADYLAIQTGQPFRKLHSVLAAAVEASEPAQQIQLGALNGQLAAAGIRYQMSREEWATLSDPVARIARRDHTGSPAPDRVKTMATGLLDDLKAAREAHRRWQAHLASARKRLDRLVNRAVK